MALSNQTARIISLAIAGNYSSSHVSWLTEDLPFWETIALADIFLALLLRDSGNFIEFTLEIH